jgi:hypothetical protein
MTDTKTSKKWTPESVETLLNTVGTESPVSAASVTAAAAALDVSERSVASKLRQLDREVVSLAKAKEATFTTEEGDALAKFVNANPGVYTYKELAEQFPGEFSAKQIQGKLLALELSGSVKPAPKVEAARNYSDAEESTFVTMAKAGKFIEEIAVTLGKEIASVRGKALSLLKGNKIDKIPAQKTSHAKDDTDPVAALGDKIATMTVAAIAAAVDKSDRGIKTLLTRRGIKVADYDGAVKRAKAEAKNAVAA